MFIFGIICLVLELNPSLIIKRGNAKNVDSLYFFESISVKEFSQFKQEVLQADTDSEINDILFQIYINAKICTKKYRYTRIGIASSMIGTFGIIVMFLAGWLVLVLN